MSDDVVPERKKEIKFHSTDDDEESGDELRVVKKPKRQHEVVVLYDGEKDPDSPSTRPLVLVAGAEVKRLPAPLPKSGGYWTIPESITIEQPDPVHRGGDPVAQKIIDQVNKFAEFDVKVAQQYLIHLYEIMTSGDISMGNVFQNYGKIIGIGSDFNVLDEQQKYAFVMAAIQSSKVMLIATHSDNSSMGDVTYGTACLKLQAFISHMHRCLNNLSTSMCIVSDDVMSSHLEQWEETYVPRMVSDNKRVLLVNYFVSQIYMYRLKRGIPKNKTDEGKLYFQERVSLPDGRVVLTHYWTKLCTIPEFIRGVGDNKSNEKIYSLLLESGNRDLVEKELRAITDVPDLIPSVGWTVCDDALYHSQTNKRYRFAVEEEFRQVPAQVVAETYVKGKCPDTEQDLLSYCPKFLKILTHQGFKGQPLIWICGLLGRLLLPLHHMPEDTEEVAPFLLGYRRTGKTVIIKLIQSLVPAEGFAVMSPQVQKQFALGILRGKRLFTMSEMERRCNIDTSQLCQLLSHEYMNVTDKNEKAETTLLNCTALFAGNDMPFKDVFSALARRFVYIPFNTLVENSQEDGSIERDTRENLISLMVMLNRCYLYILSELKKKNQKFWAVCPKEFREWNATVKEDTDLLTQFFNSEFVTFNENYSVTLTNFRTAYKSYLDTVSTEKRTNAMVTPELIICIEKFLDQKCSYKRETKTFFGFQIAKTQSGEIQSYVPTSSSSSSSSRNNERRYEDFD